MLPETLKRDLHHLRRTDKVKAMQLLIDDLALEEEFGIVSGAQYEIWSPYDSAEASTILTKLLEEDRNERRRIDSGHEASWEESVISQALGDALSAGGSIDFEKLDARTLTVDLDELFPEGKDDESTS